MYRLREYTGYYLDRSPKFDFSDPNTTHDKILLVENVKFHIESEFLSVLSPVLKGLFNESSEATEVTIPNVKADDFRRFLNFVYGTGKAVTAPDCATVLDMAIHFAVPAIIDDCLDYIDPLDPNISVKHLLDIYEVVHKHNLIYQMHYLCEEFFSYEYPLNYGEELRSEWSRVEQMSKEAQDYILEWMTKPRSAFSEVPYRERRHGMPTLPVLDFTDPSIHHDRTLLVEGKEFYVVSKFLATWSGYFRAMFYGKFKESQQDRIQLHGISAVDFNDFLQSIHQNGRNIGYDQCSSIIDIAWYFDCQGLVQLCCHLIVAHGMSDLLIHLSVVEVAMKHNMQDMKMFFACQVAVSQRVQIDEYLAKNGQMSDDLRLFLQEIKQGTYKDCFFNINYHESYY